MGEGNYGFDLTSSITSVLASVCGADFSKCGASGVTPDCAYGLRLIDEYAVGGIPRLQFLRSTYKQDPCGLVPLIDARIAQLQANGGTMGFGDFLLDNVIKPIGGAIGTVVQNLPQIANTVAGAAQSIQAIQATLGGMPTAVAGINPATGSTGAVQGPMWTQEAFTAACRADPTGQCQAAIAAALQGGSGMTMPGMNPTTGSPIQAGVLGPLISNPAVQQALRALGLGALIGAGTEAVGAIGSGIAGLIGGGSSAGATGPLLMNWPAATPLPRSIVLRAPDKPEKRYRTVGAPLLSSGDVSAVRRVQRAASRARKGRGRRSPRAPQVIQIGSGQTHHVCGSCLSSPCGCK